MQKVNVQLLGRMKLVDYTVRNMITFILKRFGRMKISAYLENLLTYHIQFAMFHVFQIAHVTSNMRQTFLVNISTLFINVQVSIII